MRSTLAIFMGFVILFSSSYYTVNQISNTSEIIQAQLLQVEDLLQSEHWDEASLKINESYEHWLEIKDWWAFVLNHNTLNTIEICFIRLQQYSLNKKISLSLAELNTIVALLKDIPKAETVSLNNIL